MIMKPCRIMMRSDNLSSMWTGLRGNAKHYRERESEGGEENKEHREGKR
jgi:hypothetical protein